MLHFKCVFMQRFKEFEKIRNSVSSTKVVKTVRKYLHFFLILKQFELKILLRILKVCVFVYLFFRSDAKINQNFNELMLWFEIKWWVNVMEKFTKIFINFLCILLNHFWSVTEVLAVIRFSIHWWYVTAEELLPSDTIHLLTLKHALN